MIERKLLFSIARPSPLIEWLEDIDPLVYIEKLKSKADIFTFWERIPTRTFRIILPKKYEILYEQDQVAAISLVDYNYWWEKQIDRKTRNMVRKAWKKGVKVEVCSLNDDLIKGIERIYNETPIRQGIPFKHFGEKFDKIKKDLKASEKYPQEFIRAFYEGKMIGFIHLLYSKETAIISQLLSMHKYRSIAPNNALVAKAVELAYQRGVRFLIYERMPKGPLGEFKRNNGFEQMPVRRYYLPLSLKGKLILNFKLHRGLKGVLPGWLKDFLRLLRDHLIRPLK